MFSWKSILSTVQPGFPKVSLDAVEMSGPSGAPGAWLRSPLARHAGDAVWQVFMIVDQDLVSRVSAPVTLTCSRARSADLSRARARPAARGYGTGPSLDDLARPGERAEPVLVQPLLPEPANEALHGWVARAGPLGRQRRSRDITKACTVQTSSGERT
jgi:hypothetical protein